MGRRSALLIHNKLLLLLLYKHILKPVWPYGIQLWGRTSRATLASFSDFKTRYLRTSSMHLGISEMPTSIGTFKWRRLRMKLESSLRSTKNGFCTTSTSERSSCSTTVK